MNHALQAEHSEEIETLAAEEQQRRLRKQAEVREVEDRGVELCEQLLVQLLFSTPGRGRRAWR
ncbi:MAG TPA: hypothetical protein VGD37_40690 [Kofleriaceae bacterium]